MWSTKLYIKMTLTVYRVLDTPHFIIISTLWKEIPLGQQKIRGESRARELTSESGGASFHCSRQGVSRRSILLDSPDSVTLRWDPCLLRVFRASDIYPESPLGYLSRISSPDSDTGELFPPLLGNLSPLLETMWGSSSLSVVRD